MTIIITGKEAINLRVGETCKEMEGGDLEGVGGAKGRGRVR